MRIGEVAKVADELEGVRRTELATGLLQWSYHGRLIARQLDASHLVIRVDFDFRESLVHSHPQTFSVPTRYVKHMMVVADFAVGNAAAIDDALDNAWQLQRSAD